MRGKAVNDTEITACFGITPAYAGKSHLQHHQARLKEDHPRLCGEKAEQRWKICRILGSPPPMRGKADLFHTRS